MNLFIQCNLIDTLAATRNDLAYNVQTMVSKLHDAIANAIKISISPTPLFNEDDEDVQVLRTRR